MKPFKGIRKLPGARSEVDDLIDLVQQKAPSLDRRPSFIPNQTLEHSKKKFVPEQPEGDLLLEQGFVFQQGSDGTLRKVRVVPGPVRQSTGSSGRIGAGGRQPVFSDQESDPETSGDEDCDDEPRPGHKFRWRRDAGGDKYYVEELVKNTSPEMVYKYVRDVDTGRSYKRLVLKNDPDRELVRQWVIDPNTGKKVQMLVPTTSSSSTSRPQSGKQSSGRRGGKGQFSDQPGQFHCSALVTPESQMLKPLQPTFSVAQPSAPTEDKQGKMPNIVTYARNCPIAWTKKVTSDKLNMGLWCWAFVAELLATRTGQAPTLLPGELEARLQHYLNVLEIALQPGSAAEFDNHAWRVARLYAEKVQHKIDRGETWLGFQGRYGADSQPHELMAAEKELAPKVYKKPKNEDDKSGFKQKDDKSAKRTCTSWNTSSVEGKCDWEVQNENRACSRRHECSWCKEKGKKSLAHQRSFWRQRIAAGDQ